jgi:hypothetical protein
MPVQRIYDLAETENAINRADGRHVNALKMVRSDVSVEDWGRTHIPVRDRNPSLPGNLQFPGQKDSGHVFRHVADTAEAGKSIYQDRLTAIAVTCELLNSPEGQTALGALDAESRDLYDNTTRRITASLSGVWYGARDDGAPWERITSARCEVMKLGDALWIHSSYPYRFQVGPSTP